MMESQVLPGFNRTTQIKMDEVVDNTEKKKSLLRGGNDSHPPTAGHAGLSSPRSSELHSKKGPQLFGSQQIISRLYQDYLLILGFFFFFSGPKSKKK